MIAHDNKYSYHHLDQHKGSRLTGFPPTKVENKNVMFFVCLGDNYYNDDDIDTDAVSDHVRIDPRTRTEQRRR